MGKAEKYIQGLCNTGDWLTPGEAREAVRIAREEVTDKTAEWLKYFCNEHYIMSYSDSHEVGTDELMETFKKKMEE